MYNIYLNPDSKFALTPGMRGLIVMPPAHPTSWIHSSLIPWNFGVTQILQPFFSNEEFFEDLVSLRPEYTLAAPAQSLALLSTDIKENSLSHMKDIWTGGEPILRKEAIAINKKLEYAGVQHHILKIGYGMSEFGTIALLSNDNRENLANWNGKPLLGVNARILDANGREIKGAGRGELEIKTPARMKGYFNNSEETAKFFTSDGYGRTHDIAKRDKDGNYVVLGRSDDSFVDNEGNKHYLFDIENILSECDVVQENEAQKLVINTKEIVVVHIVLTNDYTDKRIEGLQKIISTISICHLSENAKPKAYRFVKDFGTNPISHKRDWQALRHIRDGYYNVDERGIYKISFPVEGSGQKRYLPDDETIVIYE
jgi:acyl-CoA synthetase (AMP-forming)/AMP-acid ligase II